MRVTQELDTLAGFSDVAAPAVTRIVFSEQDLRARAWLKGLCSDAGLVVREDAVGNTFARWVGSEPALRRRGHWIAYRCDSAFGTVRRDGGCAGRTGSDSLAAGARGAGHGGRSNWCCSLRKSRRDSGSDVWAAG